MDFFVHQKHHGMCTVILVIYLAIINHSHWQKMQRLVISISGFKASSYILPHSGEAYNNSLANYFTELSMEVCPIVWINDFDFSDIG